MSDDKKRLLRETKRQIKKDGNRSRRRHLKKQLEEDPENAHLADDYDYEYNSSTFLNGFDKDATRIRKEEDYSDKMNQQDNLEDEERY